MHTRLLSFLTDIESALATDDPTPGDGGNWCNSRTVNYHLGLARLTISVCPLSDSPQPRGSIMLQSYALADGTPCLKAALSWTGQERSCNRAIYSKPGTDWKSEARKVAAEWMAGPPAAAEEPADKLVESAAAIAG